MSFGFIFKTQTTSVTFKHLSALSKSICPGEKQRPGKAEFQYSISNHEIPGRRLIIRTNTVLPGAYKMLRHKLI